MRSEPVVPGSIRRNTAAKQQGRTSTSKDTIYIYVLKCILRFVYGGKACETYLKSWSNARLGYHNGERDSCWEYTVRVKVLALVIV